MDIGALYALPPEEFVAARDRLVKQLRADGERERAKEVAALRRPTVPAWAVDQLAARHPEGLDRLMEAGAELQRAMRRALSGAGGGGVREAAARRRELIGSLTDTAAAILQDAGRIPDPHVSAIAATLEAATVDGEAARRVRSGTLAKELSPPSGFGDLSPLSVVPEVRPDAEPEPAAAPGPAPEEEPAPGVDRGAEGREAEAAGAAADAEAEARAQALTEAQAALTAAQERAEDAEAESRAALDAAEDARRRAIEASQVRDRLELEVAAARRHAQTATRRADDADAAAARVNEEARRRAEQLREARERLRSLEA